MTRRLYYQDPYLCEFEATKVGESEIKGRQAVLLDSTAFYPTSGGQPHDLGTLNGIPVVDVQVQDDQILHVLDGILDAPTVKGEIDWNRRFDHMQQHTGQHVLSQAFLEVVEAETVGFHLGEDASTIDLDRAPIDQDQVRNAEVLANEVVMDNRPVLAHFVEERDLAKLPLRKPPAVAGPIRVVQVTAFDWSACGGTHVRATGEIGPVKTLRVERRKDKTRIHFLCGWRALRDYEHKQRLAQDLTAHFTTSEDEILPAVERLEEESKQLRKTLAEAQTQLLERDVSDWLAGAESVKGAQVVCRILEDRDLTLVKEAARLVTGQPSTLALLATRTPSAHLVFARSSNLDMDMGAMMRAVCAEVGGRGGGSPQYAQGGLKQSDSVDRALAEAVNRLRAAV